MENGVKDVDNSLRLAEEASRKMCNCIRQWKACSASFSSLMSAALIMKNNQTGRSVIRRDAPDGDRAADQCETVRLDANKLQQLVGLFEVSNNSRRSAA
jgi:hypothetical protein